ncbi:hypothetical protein ACHAO1_010135 [Botrytis cinerea]
MTCKSSLSQQSWRPAWDREGREPAWASTKQNWHNPFGGNRYLWGNTPAMDILKLEENERNLYEEDIAILFAASGDLRHVVKTIAGISNKLTQRLDITLNDGDFQVAARNAILLLFILNAPDITSSKAENLMSDTECLIHLWYSAFLPSYVLSQLYDRVQPLISNVCSKIITKSAGATIGKTWYFRCGRTFRLVLKKEQWVKLEKICNSKEVLSLSQAIDLRATINLTSERLDYRERWQFKDATPSMRISKQRFREDGLLLPFGHSRIGFNDPNPTLFQDAKAWPLCDRADPLAGWNIWEVDCTITPAKEDLYGKLFVYLYDMFNDFQTRLSTININFELYSLDIRDLPKYLEKDRYTRIEVANICDVGYIGILMEMVNTSRNKDNISNMNLLVNYLPQPSLINLLSPNSADTVRIWDARTIVLPADDYFERYTKLHQFSQISTNLRVKQKQVNTIVDEWPTRLKDQEGGKKAQKEFNILLSSNWIGVEHCIEWKRDD